MADKRGAQNIEGENDRDRASKQAENKRDAENKLYHHGNDRRQIRHRRAITFHRRDGRTEVDQFHPTENDKQNHQQYAGQQNYAVF